MELAKRCPYCHRNLTLNSLEPHPRRKGVDVLTFSCPECQSALSDFVLVCTYKEERALIKAWERVTVGAWL
jgi:hypothetical protein